MKRLTTEFTPKRVQILDCITPWVQEQGYPPPFMSWRTARTSPRRTPVTAGSSSDTRALYAGSHTRRVGFPYGSSCRRHRFTTYRS
jgi:hypothetical protein